MFPDLKSYPVWKICQFKVCVCCGSTRRTARVKNEMAVVGFDVLVVALASILIYWIYQKWKINSRFVRNKIDILIISSFFLNKIKLLKSEKKSVCHKESNDFFLIFCGIYPLNNKKQFNYRSISKVVCCAYTTISNCWIDNPPDNILW